MSRKTVAGGILLALSAVSRFLRPILGLIGLAGVAQDTSAWVEALSSPWVYGSLLLCGVVMLWLGLKNRGETNRGSEAPSGFRPVGSRRSQIQTMQSSPAAVQAGRDSIAIGSVQISAAASNQPGEVARDLDEVHQIRKRAGWLDERLGDHGPPLSEEEDEKARRWLIELKEATGSFAYRLRLRLALRDFVHEAGWMLQFKSTRGEGGLKRFQSAQEEAETRAALRTVSEELISACNEILEPGKEQPDRPRIQEGKIEVWVDPEDAFVSLIVCYSSPERADADCTTLLAVLPRIRVKNHDVAATTVDGIWLDIRNANHRKDMAPNKVALEGNRRIEARSFEDFSLEVEQVFDGQIKKEEGWFRVALKVKALGFEIVEMALAERLFRLEDTGD